RSRFRTRSCASGCRTPDPRSRSCRGTTLVVQVTANDGVVRIELQRPFPAPYRIRKLLPAVVDVPELQVHVASEALVVPNRAPVGLQCFLVAAGAIPCVPEVLVKLRQARVLK